MRRTVIVWAMTVALAQLICSTTASYDLSFDNCNCSCACDGTSPTPPTCDGTPPPPPTCAPTTTVSQYPMRLYNPIPDVVSGVHLHTINNPHWHPLDVEVDEERGIIYVAAIGTYSLCAICMSGDFKWCVNTYMDGQPQENLGARALAITPEHNIVVSDAYFVKVFSVVDDQLTLVTKWGGGAWSGLDYGVRNLPGWFNGPNGVDVYQRRLYVVDVIWHRFQILNLDDVNDITEVSAGSLDFAYPRDVAVSPKGDRVYVATFRSLFAFDLLGNYLFHFNSADFGYSSITLESITVDRFGRIFLGDRENNCVHIINDDGTYVQKITYRSELWPDYWDPEGLTINSVTGQLIVADYLNSQILIFPLALE